MMQKRFVTIWFPHLLTDWCVRRNPVLKKKVVVLAAARHGRMIITSADRQASVKGIAAGMTVADAKVIYPALEVIDDEPDAAEKLLNNIAQCCIRFTPFVAVHLPDSLYLDATGCAHLWGGEEKYLRQIRERFKTLGYHVRPAMADTVGASHALAHFGKGSCIAAPGTAKERLLPLPPHAIRISDETAERLLKLGLRTVGSFIDMPAAALRRRFGAELLKRIDQSLGWQEEILIPVQPAEAFAERLPCIEPILTATGISIALEKTLTALCSRLQKEGKGLRKAVFSCYRIDGKTVCIEIGTNRPSSHQQHLHKLFSEKMEKLEPAGGIELFVLEATQVDDHAAQQNELWSDNEKNNDRLVSELLDRFSSKLGDQKIMRFLPSAHYWPERAFQKAVSITDQPVIEWKADRPRPLHLFAVPQKIIVTAPVPDYPPMNFRYRGKLHPIIKADGPERIEQEWWLEEGLHRDYYAVEDEEGHRWWLFREGHYDPVEKGQWFLHGVFA